MIKYVTQSSYARIEEVEVESETKHFVTLKRDDGSFYKEKKTSEYNCYHDSWSQAKQYLVDKVREEIESLERQMNTKKDRMNQILSLKPTDG